MQPVVTGIAEQSGVALERARLRSVDDEARRRRTSSSGSSRPSRPQRSPRRWRRRRCRTSSRPRREPRHGRRRRGGAGEDAQDPGPATADDREWRPVPISTSTPTVDAMRAKGDRAPRPRADPRALSTGRRTAAPRIVSVLVVFRCPVRPARSGSRSRRPRLRPRRARDARCDRRRAHPGARALGPAGAGAGRPPARRADGAQCVAAGGRDHGRGRGERDRGGVPGARGRRRASVGARHRVTARAPGLVRRAGADAGSVRGVPARARRAGLGGDGDGRLAMVASAEEYDARYPSSPTSASDSGSSPLSPCPHALRAGAVGAIFAAANRQHWLDHDRRLLLLGVAEQTGVAPNGQGCSRPSARRAASQSSWSGTRHTSPPP